MPRSPLHVCPAALVAGTILLITANLAAAPPVVLNGRSEAQGLGSYLEVLEDPGGRLTLDQARNSREWRDHHGPQPGFGYTDSAYWLAFRIRNVTEAPIPLILELVSLIDSIDIYVPRTDGSWRHVHTGRWEGMATRDWKHRNFLFRMESRPAEEMHIYMRFKSAGSLLLPLSVYTLDAFARKDHEEQIGFGIYFGVIVVMVLYNLFLFAGVRDISYLYYVLYILSLGLTFASIWGFGHEYLWTFNMWWANHSIPFFIGSSTLFGALFTIKFLNTRITRPRFHLALAFFCVVSIVGMVVSLVAGYALAIRMAIVAGFCVPVLILATAIACLVKGYRPARYYTAAFAVILIGAMVIVLRNMGVLPYTFLTNYSSLVGSGIEVVVLSLALADRINLLQAEKTQLQEQAFSHQKRMTDSFARFVPREFLELLGKDDLLSIELGDQIERTMTVLFSDIRSFTTLSETMTPKDNFDFLNAYLREVSPSIERHGGFVDKYIGDEIMALFPVSTEGAIRSAVEMHRNLESYNERRRESGYQELRIGVGIHTGRLMLGILGTTVRMQGTVISDAVNLGSRLEGLTKLYGVRVIISQASLEEIENPDQFVVRFLGKLRVKGKRVHVSVFEVCDADTTEQLRLKRQTKERFEQGVKAFHRRQFEPAQDDFAFVVEANPADVAAANYLQRARDYFARRP